MTGEDLALLGALIDRQKQLRDFLVQSAAIAAVVGHQLDRVNTMIGELNRTPA